MDNQFKFLTIVPVGQYRCSKWYEIWKQGGWISVEREENGDTSLMWTSDKESHNPMFCGNAVAVTINSFGKMISFFESAINLWLKWGYGRGTEVERLQGLECAKWMEGILKEFVLKEFYENLEQEKQNRT